jgi:hypothetical protein
VPEHPRSHSHPHSRKPAHARTHARMRTQVQLSAPGRRPRTVTVSHGSCSHTCAITHARAHTRNYACTRTGDCVRGVNALLRGTATSAEPTARSGNGSAADTDVTAVLPAEYQPLRRLAHAGDVPDLQRRRGGGMLRSNANARCFAQPRQTRCSALRRVCAGADAGVFSGGADFDGSVLVLIRRVAQHWAACPLRAPPTEARAHARTHPPVHTHARALVRTHAHARAQARTRTRTHTDRRARTAAPDWRTGARAAHIALPRAHQAAGGAAARWRTGARRGGAPRCIVRRTHAKARQHAPTKASTIPRAHRCILAQTHAHAHVHC